MWPINNQATLYPPTCLLCGAQGRQERDLCHECAQDLPHNPHACKHCALPLPSGSAVAVCGFCQKRPPGFDRAFAPFRYQNPVDHLLGRFKYQGSLSHGRLLGDLFLQQLIASDAPLPEVIIPAPMHASRLRERGLNQTAELARHLSRSLNIPWRHDVLLKQRHTDTQRGLTRRQRRQNIKGSFVCEGPLPWRHVALLDDVITTGTTAEEMARSLRRAGIEEISLWAVARTPEGV